MRYKEDGSVSHTPLVSDMEITLSPSGFEWMRSGVVSQFGMPNEKKVGHAEAWELC